MPQAQLALQTESDLVVSEDLFDEIVRSEEKFCLEIRKCDPQDAIINLMNGYKEAFDYLQPYLSPNSQPKILEIGSGNGFGLCYLLKSGLDITGIEPGSEISFEGRFQRAIKLLELNGITSATSHLLAAHAEQLPFEDNTFDLVFSLAVLEHVKDVGQSMREALRVVKPNGLVIMNVPNYNSFREGHYNILWLPYLLTHKRVAKWYVRTIFRRPDYYIDELNFTNPRYFKKLAKALPECREMKIYRFCEPPFANFSYQYYLRQRSLLPGTNPRFQNESARSIFRGIRTFRGRVRYGLHLVLRFLFKGWTLKLLSALGLVPVFNVICSKRPSADSTSVE